jgi:D-xylulose reductase
MTQARSLVLERKGQLTLRDIDIPSDLGPEDVRIRIHTVGICGSDVHYYTHGHIGPFEVREPMVLGHEASGTIIETGSAVRGLKIGDRVCMEPGIPNQSSRASKLGIYNVDPAVRFWATPPIHGCLTGTVVHPAAYTFKLPETVSFAEGAMVEPFAIGVQAAFKGAIRPGDTCLVTGCGTIGLMVALAAIGAGAGRVIISDVVDAKLDLARQYDGLIPVNVARDSLRARVDALCGADWGCDVVLEASGSPRVFDDVIACVRPGGTIVFVGMPPDKIAFDLVSAQAKEVRMETVFRYANVFDRAIEMISSGKVKLTPLIAETFDFEQSVAAFERAASARPTDIKLQIVMPAQG